MDHEWRKDPRKRAAASKHLRVLSDQAITENKSADELQQENVGARVLEGGIPVMWGNTAGHRVRGQSANITTPNAEQREMAQVEKTCAACVYFDVKNGRKEIVRQQFAEKLVLEYEWALRHIGGGVDHLALCARSNGELCVTSMSPACDGFRERKGRI